MASRTLLRREKRMYSIRDNFKLTILSKQPLERPRLTVLPPEIHLQIFKHLTPAGQLSLGLTCKAFWTAMHNEHTGQLRVLMIGDDKYELLCLLSNSLPRHVACNGCGLLHERDVDEFQCMSSGGLYKLCNNTRAAFPAPCLKYALSYEMLDLALRFHELSSAHGMPLALLSHQCDLHNYYAKAMPCRVEVLPRIREGRLLLRIDSFVEVDRTKSPGDQVDRLFCPCIHMPAPVFELHCALNLQVGAMNSRSRQWCAMERCSGCATDVSTRLMLSDDGSLVKGLLVRVWKDLGGRGGCGKQPWTGHIAATPTCDDAVYLSSAKHLGHVFDNDTVEFYDRRISLGDVQAGLLVQSP